MGLQTLQAGLVKSLSTKFFHKDDHLQFQIALLYENNTILYKDFDNYDAYRENHDKLVKALNSDTAIPDDFVHTK